MVTGECDGEIGENKQFLRREKQDTGQNLRPRVPTGQNLRPRVPG